jgi:hypothetical protein
MEIVGPNFEPGVTPEVFSSLYPRLYHMAHEDAWEQIQRYGLLRTRSILNLWEAFRVVDDLSKTNLELAYLNGVAAI